MPPDPDVAAASSSSPADPPAASARSSSLEYAPAAKGRSVRRWMARHPVLLVLLAVGLAAAISWQGWKWQLRRDWREFEVCAKSYSNGKDVWFTHPPTRGALRHLSRLPGASKLTLDWPAAEAKDGAAAFAAVPLANVTEIHLKGGVDGDPMIKVLARPDSGLKALTALFLEYTKATDAGLKELARPDCGLKALTELYVMATNVTAAGIAELKKARPGLKIWH